MLSWTEALDVLRSEGALEPGTLPRKGTAAYRRLQEDARSIGWEPISEPRARSMSRSRSRSRARSAGGRMPSRSRSRSRSVGGRLKACGSTRDGTQKVRTEDRPRCHDPRAVPRRVSEATRAAPCNVGLVRSEVTGRCYRPREPADCKAGQERNPATGRCRKPVARADCKPGWERFAASGRCRKLVRAPRKPRARAARALAVQLAQEYRQPAQEIENVADASGAPLDVAAERLAEVHSFPEALVAAAERYGQDPDELAQQIAEASIVDNREVNPEEIADYSSLIASASAEVEEDELANILRLARVAEAPLRGRSRRR